MHSRYADPGGREMRGGMIAGEFHEGEIMPRTLTRRVLPGLVLLAATLVHAARAPAVCTLNGAVPSPEVAAEHLLCAKGTGRLLIVGELHGTLETPALVSDIVTHAVRAQPVRLGLEAPAYLAPILADYVRSDGSPDQRATLLRSGFWKGQDGRAGTGWLSLIDSVRRLRSSGADIDIFTMEPDYEALAGHHPGEAVYSQKVKEAGMVGAVRAKLRDEPKALVVALMGSFHAGLYRQSQEAKGGKEHSVAERLKAASPLVVYPVAHVGNAWYCDADACGVHSLKGRADAISTPTFEPDKNDSRVVHTILLWLPRFSASSPVTAG